MKNNNRKRIFIYIEFDIEKLFKSANMAAIFSKILVMVNASL